MNEKLSSTAYCGFGFLCGVIFGSIVAVLVINAIPFASTAATLASSTGETIIATSSISFLAPSVSQEDQVQDQRINEILYRLDALDGGKMYYWSCPNVIGQPVVTIGKETVKQMYGYTGCTQDTDFKSYFDATGSIILGY